ncbi:MAG: hypothetical protein WCG45_02690 [bacterium]
MKTALPTMEPKRIVVLVTLSILKNESIRNTKTENKIIIATVSEIKIQVLELVKSIYQKLLIIKDGRAT